MIYAIFLRRQNFLRIFALLLFASMAMETLFLWAHYPFDNFSCIKWVCRAQKATWIQALKVNFAYLDRKLPFISGTSRFPFERKNGDHLLAFPLCIVFQELTHLQNCFICTTNLMLFTQLLIRRNKYLS